MEKKAKFLFLKETSEYRSSFFRRELDLPDEKIRELELIFFEKEVLKKYEKKTVYNFVGAVVYNGTIIFFLPKYFDMDKTADEKLDHMKTIFRVLEKYRRTTKKKKQQDDNLDITGDEKNRETGKFRTACFLLNDYFENGLYIKHSYETEQNGSDEIIWDKTMESFNPYTGSRNTVYFDYYSRTRNESDNVITGIHKYLITEAANYLEDFRRFGIINTGRESFPVSVRTDPEYLKYEIKKELEIQFRDDKIRLLKGMLDFVSDLEKEETDEGIALLGTTSYYHVWEIVCRVICRDIYDSDPDIKRIVRDYASPRYYNQMGLLVKQKESIVPDIVFIKNGRLVVADAKYYNFGITGNSMTGEAPDSYSVSKQYLYLESFRKARENETDMGTLADVTSWGNCFLIPGDSIEKIGMTDMGLFQATEENSAEKIQVWKIAAGLAYKYFLKGQELQELTANI